MSRKIQMLMLLAASMLTACASGTPPTQAEPRHCAAALRAECPEPPPAESGSLADLFRNHIQEAEMHKLCRDRQRALAECESGDGSHPDPPEEKKKPWWMI